MRCDGCDVDGLRTKPVPCNLEKFIHADMGLVAMDDNTLAKIVVTIVALISFMLWSAPFARVRAPKCADNCVTDLSANRR